MSGQRARQDYFLMRIGDTEIRYYMREPSPNTWNAVGTFVEAREQPIYRTSENYRMVVGVGPTPDEAKGDLIARVMSEFDFVRDQVRPGRGREKTAASRSL